MNMLTPVRNNSLRRDGYAHHSIHKMGWGSVGSDLVGLRGVAGLLNIERKLGARCQGVTSAESHYPVKAGPRPAVRRYGERGPPLFLRERV
jgi:hypothetical protein